MSYRGKATWGRSHLSGGRLEAEWSRVTRCLSSGGWEDGEAIVQNDNFPREMGKKPFAWGKRRDCKVEREHFRWRCYILGPREGGLQGQMWSDFGGTEGKKVGFLLKCRDGIADFRQRYASIR